MFRGNVLGFIVTADSRPCKVKVKNAPAGFFPEVAVASARFTRTRSLVLSEQLEAHRLPAFVFDFEVARHGSRADVEWMRLARSPIGERSEFQSRAIKLRLVSDDDSGAGGGRNACKFPY